MEDECQNCRRFDASHPVKIHFSDCGHSLCDACFKEKFREHSRTYMCTVCRVELSRGDFYDKPKDEREYERQKTIRQRVLDIFNEEAEDFPSLEAYYSHLETVEDLIERYMTGQGLLELQKQLEEHEKAYHSQINARKIRRAEAKRLLRRDATIEDAIYDESKREEAARLKQEIEDELLRRKYQPKEMPDCENIDSVPVTQKCDLSELSEDLRLLFLRASGCDFRVAELCSLEELRDGLSDRMLVD